MPFMTSRKDQPADSPVLSLSGSFKSERAPCEDVHTRLSTRAVAVRSRCCQATFPHPRTEFVMNASINNDDALTLSSPLLGLPAADAVQDGFGYKLMAKRAFSPRMLGKCWKSGILRRFALRACGRLISPSSGAHDGVLKQHLRRSFLLLQMTVACLAFRSKPCGFVWLTSGCVVAQICILAVALQQHARGLP